MIRNRVLALVPAAPLLLACVALLPSGAQAQAATESVLGTLQLNSNSAVIQASDGNYYGTGDSDFSEGGVVFAVTPGGAVTYPYGLTGGADGGDTEAPPVQGPDGAFYGAGGAGGQYDYGVIYRLSGTTETVLYSFTGGTDGGQPESNLVFDNAGNLYGTAAAGGANRDGTVFKFNIDTSTFTVLHQFCSMTNCIDGTSPFSGLVQGIDGDFYGVAIYGGADGAGTFYKVTSSGAFTLLSPFCTTHVANCAEGYDPHGPLVQASDGNFYGGNLEGGANQYGTVFKATPAGSITPVYTFTGGTDGSDAYGLAVASDGNLYGSTLFGGNPNDCNNGDTAGCGAFYKVTTGGAFTLLYDFTDADQDALPYGGPMQGSDGSLYGTTFGFDNQGSQENGAVYKITPKTPLAAPIQLSFNETDVAPGTQVTLSWQSLNSFSMTLQLCYAYVQGGATGAGTWTGQQIGAYNGTTHIYSGSAKITPTAQGTYTYALTCGGMESGFATLTVASDKDTSTTAVTASPNPVDIGQNGTLTATVKGTGTKTPTGNVTFYYDGITLTTVALNGSGVASVTLSTNGEPAGTYAISARYAGDDNYDLSASNNINVTLAAGPTSTTVTASPTTVTPPASVKLTATVKRTASGAAGVPTGQVTFYADGSVKIGTATLSGGVATYTTSTSGVAAGTYQITAAYGGDSGDKPSTSAAVSVVAK